MASMDTIYVKDGWEACMVEYGTNVKLVKQLIEKGFHVTQVLPPDQVECIGYTLVWTKKVPHKEEVPKVVIY